ncbi:unnamed protein product [Phytophthora lilii]|uniref:Unnamed protein product n=1 Tax=Phytophthora lilii TaxID=2077276 RepID=A0A9W6X188_9STRA|nr:unnamed protein product [Phytophthora lilii]
MTREKVALPSVGIGCGVPLGSVKPQSAPYTEVSSMSVLKSLKLLAVFSALNASTLPGLLPSHLSLFHTGSICTIQAEFAEPLNCDSGISM